MKKLILCLSLFLISCATTPKEEVKQPKQEKVEIPIKDIKKSFSYCHYIKDNNRGLCIFKVEDNKDIPRLEKEAETAIYNFCEFNGYFQSKTEVDPKMGVFFMFRCEEQEQQM